MLNLKSAEKRALFDSQYASKVSIVLPCSIDKKCHQQGYLQYSHINLLVSFFTDEVVDGCCCAKRRQRRPVMKMGVACQRELLLGVAAATI